MIKGEAINTPVLDVDLSGGGEITLKGNSDAQRVSVSGLGSVRYASQPRVERIVSGGGDFWPLE